MIEIWQVWIFGQSRVDDGFWREWIYARRCAGGIYFDAPKRRASRCPPKATQLTCVTQIKIPTRGKIYSFNEGNSMYFFKPVVDYLNSIKYPPQGKLPYSARYIGSMVADVHRTLLYGGIFGYPNDKKSKNGKLRLLYEAFPMAFLTEQVRGTP